MVASVPQSQTRGEVKDQLARAARELQDGRRPTSARLTVESYLTDWLAEARASVRPGTLRRYEQVVRVQLVPELGRIPLSQLKPADVEAMSRRILRTPRPAAWRTRARSCEPP